jgi:hypothetical protein
MILTDKEAKTLTRATPPVDGTHKMRKWGKGRRRNSISESLVGMEGRLTALWCRRKEADLDFFFAKLIGEPNNSIPGTCTNRVAVHVEIVYEMNLPSSIHRNLVAGADGQAWVIARTIIQDSFARSGIRLLVNCTLNRKFLLNATRGK